MLLKGDIANVSFGEYKNKIDILSGGFLFQTFSYAGKNWVMRTPGVYYYLNLQER